MTSMHQQKLSLHYDGNDWKAIDAHSNMLTLSVHEGDILPTLPDHSLVTSILFPVEQLLSRTFTLPFSSPKFIDQDILKQELEEQTSENSESWWISWQAGKTEHGVSGIMFGLPESWRHQIDKHASWQQTQNIGSDINLRLNAQREQSINAHPELQQATEPMAVFDADRDGLFFAVWHASENNKKSGFWLAMRRLNWSDIDDIGPDLVENIKRSLHEMGWQHDHSSLGFLPTELHTALDLSTWYGELEANANLPSRQDANIAASGSSNLNFRHGRWRSVSHLGQFKAWYRSAVIAVALMLIWTVGMMWDNHQLQQQISSHQQHIIEAFHTGLPHESVMIDALAQLRKAAGGGNKTDQKNQLQARQWLQYIQSINRVYQQAPWKMIELSFHNGRMIMRGECKDLQSMNRIQKALQQEIGLNVQIQDTDLRNNLVKFKLVWS